MIDILYQTIQSQKSGSSGTGTSHYGVSASCGMKSRLYERYPFIKQEEQEDEYEANYDARGKLKVSGTRAGSFYHKLQELWRLGTIPSNLAIDASHADYDFQIALRSFNNYRNRFNSDVNNLGRVRGAEGLVPSTDAEREAIKAALGGLPFTIRYDLLTEIGPEDIGRIAVERGCALPGPGLYIIDYKLLASIGKSTSSAYTHGFQQLAYPVIWNICNPTRPVRGMLTDVITRVQTLEAKHTGLYLAHADENALAIVRDSVQRAQKQHELGEANAFACDGKYGPCGHLSSGLCPRYGKFGDFKWNDDKTYEPLVTIGAKT